MSVTGAPVPSYRPAGRYDELLDERGRLRGTWADALDVIGVPDAAELSRRRVEAERLLAGAGATHAIDDHRHDWRIDPLPYLVAGSEWDRLAAGVAQRAQVLAAYLADLNGPRRLLEAGVVPPELAFGPHGVPLATHGVRPPAERLLVRYGASVVRRDDGRFVVLHDHTDAPEGAAVALLHRATLARLVPGAVRRLGVRPQSAWFQALRDALGALAPDGVDSPRIVVLGPSRGHPGSFEPSYLAAQLGYHLADPDDLAVRGGRLWLRSIEGPEPVDVVLRCVGEDAADPLELASGRGVPGLLAAARSGSVGLANPLGSAAGELLALSAYLPAVARALLGEDLLIPSVDTWWCGDPQQRAVVLERLGSLVIHECGEHETTMLGWHLDERDLAAVEARVRRDPGRFVAQERLVTASTPVHGPNGLVAGHVILRTFAVAGDAGWQVLPGGVARVVDPSRPLLAQQDAVAKDVWVVGGRPGIASRPARLRTAPQVDLRQSLPSRAAEGLYWVGRNAERVEAVTRLGLVVGGRLEAEPELAEDDGGAWARATTAALGAVSGGHGAGAGTGHDPIAALRAALAGRPGSLDDSLHHLLRTSVAVREYLSATTWRVLASLAADRAALTDERDRGPGPIAERLERVSFGLAALAGLAQESTVRGPGWRFLESGRRLERALCLLNAIEAALVEPVPAAVAPSVTETLLQGWESLVAYRRLHRSDVETDAALDLLLLDPTNPRAVAFQIDRLVEHLAALPHRPGVPPPVGLVTPVAAAVLAADAATLARTGTDGRRAALHAFVLDVRGRLLAAADGITHTWFTAAGPPHRLRREQF
jgi:uncharacterized circularly permuted ATP-grasp superfamily protein/uncharacterized alpha-E superfamily protein